MPNTSPANQQTGSSGAEAGRRWLRTDNILLVASLAFFVWFTGDVLLLVFAGLLLAVGLDGLASSVKSWTPLSHGWALLAVLILLAAFLAVIGMTVVPQFLAQLDQLWETLVGFAERAQETLSRYEWAQRLMQDSEGGGGAAEAASAIARQAASAMLAALGVASSLVILLAIAIFAAAGLAKANMWESGFAAMRAAAAELRHDIARLAARFDASFEQVCHRLATLRRPAAVSSPGSASRGPRKAAAPRWPAAPTRCRDSSR